MAISTIVNRILPSMKRRLSDRSRWSVIQLLWWTSCTLWFALMPTVKARLVPDSGQKAAAAALTAAAYATSEPAAASAGIVNSSSSSSSSNTTAYGCPKHPVFSDPWVQDNIALTYSRKIRDGLGGQVQRIMAIYAVAKALGVGYVHNPFQCIGHIGPYPHYRKNRTCDHLEPRDEQQLKRVITYLRLPNTTNANVRRWNTAWVYSGSWYELGAAVQRAADKKQPTIIRMEMLAAFINRCPNMFHHVPSWRPDWAYQHSSHRVPAEQHPPWLLGGARPVRIAVHMRRGDLLLNDSHMWRGLPTSYFMNVVNNIAQILDTLHHDYTVEWFTEPSSTPEGREDMARVRREVPNLSVHLDTDLLWNWHQMASADVLITSLSAYSYVPAVVNAQGLIIRPKSSNRCRQGPGACQPSNWFEPADERGVLGRKIVREIHRRWGNGTRASSTANGLHQEQQLQQV